MNEKELSPEQRGRFDAYVNKGGFTYDRHSEDAGITTIHYWHYLKGVEEVVFTQKDGSVADIHIDPNDIAALEARAAELKRASDYVKRVAKLKESWGASSSGLLRKLLDRAVSLKPLPKNSGVYRLRADEMSDDLSWGPGAWTVGMIGAQRARGALTLDIQLSDVLLQDDDTRQQAYGFVAGAIAMKCIPYDRSKRRALRSTLVQPDPHMEHSFSSFDYVREMLERDQRADVAALRSQSGAAMKAGLAAVRAVHAEELAMLGGSGEV